MPTGKDVISVTSVQVSRDIEMGMISPEFSSAFAYKFAKAVSLALFMDVYIFFLR